VQVMQGQSAADRYGSRVSRGRGSRLWAAARMWM
jgi:hypothetical protein